MTRSSRDERGSATIEAAVGVPAFALFIGLIILGGRTAMAHEAVQSAAADAARTASIARSSADAARDAEQAARENLANQGIRCRSVGVRVDTRALGAAAGEPGSVSASVVCRLDLSDLSVPGVPGSRTVRVTMTSPLDQWRERGDSR